MLTETFDVFISYSHLDADWVTDWLLPRLESAGFKVCIDFRDFNIGVPSLDNMADAAARSRKTLFVMTPNWTVSEFSQFEALVTQTIDPIGRKGRLLPLMLKDCDLPARLQLLTYADFRNSDHWDTELTRLVANVGKPSVAEELSKTRPELPPNFVHPYPLQANFSGRVKEREQLSSWFVEDEHPIYEIVAMGGMGKSALTWYWLRYDLLRSRQPGPDGVMWWSFYEGESSFTRFIDEALKYVSGKAIDAERVPTTYDRAEKLLDYLRSQRVLFVLDGFERQLKDYANLDAVYRPDDQTERPTYARSCVDPVAGRFVRDIAAGITSAKLLITTRLPIGDLEDRAGDPLAGVCETRLKEMSRDDALTFMRAQGVTEGTDAEIANACGDYGYHALSLRLLSCLISHDAKLPGNIKAAPRHDVHADLIQRQHHVLQQAYDALPKRERALLSRIAGFRGPMTYAAISVLNNLRSEKEFELALEDLRVRGLLQRDTRDHRYDLHPIVRHYAYERLNDKKSVHALLANYFSTIIVPDSKVDALEHLAPVVELYHHTLRAGRYDEAIELLNERLVPNPLHFRFGAYQLIAELVRGLFPDGVDHLPGVSREDAQAWALTSLGNVYAATGDSRASVPLFVMANEIYERRLRNDAFHAIGLLGLAIAQSVLGELAGSERALRESIRLSVKVKDEVNEANCRQELGLLMAYRGLFNEAWSELTTAQSVFDRYGAAMTNFVSVVRASKAQVGLLAGDSTIALEAAWQARTLARDVERLSQRVERDFVYAEWLLGAATLLEGKDLSSATEHLGNAITLCRRINLVELEPDILLAWARLYRAKSNPQEAQRSAQEALAIADRCEYRLKQAEIHNLLAALALDAGDRDGAHTETLIAKERAWCDGPPNCYKLALEEADKMLEKLGR
jgi:tetratricopeptide (TPR) repeat protein